MMKKFKILFLVGVIGVMLVSCASKDKPNYQFMPNMYEAVGYETYDEVEFLPNNSEAMLPVENTIPRGKVLYGLPNTPEGKELSVLVNSPLDSLNMENNLSEGKALYDIYCAVCHGAKGDGQGNLVKREKILGVPSYADAARNITVGSTYHTIYYGLNSMGSYANQLSNKERWQVSEYVVKLREDLSK